MDASSSEPGVLRFSGTSSRAIVKQEMDDCEGHILALDAAMIDLVYKRYALKTKLNATSSFMAKLPDEIISEIFDLINESEDKNNTRSFPVPFLLGRICKAWRHIAWTRPRLWSFISIHFQSKDAVKINAQELLLRGWLLRSRNYHLHYFITFGSTTSGAPPSLAKLILSTCARWKTFTTNSIFPISSRLKKGQSFPNLSTLNASIAPKDPKYDFSAAPLLRHLQVDGVGGFHSMTVSWQHLLSVTLTCNLDDAFVMIKELKAIQTLDLEIFHDGRNFQNSPPNTLPTLLNLEIKSGATRTRKFLAAITTPALKSLKLVLASRTDRQWAASIEELYKRSPFSLSSLSLENSDIPEEVMITLLHRFRSLSSLSLLRQMSGLSDVMVNRLNPNNKNYKDYFLPALTQFSYKGLIAFNYNSMVDMLEQRLLFSQNRRTRRQFSALRNMDVTYENLSWNREKDRSNPNRIQAFYRKINDLECRGTTLKLVWEEKPKPDLDFEFDLSWS